MNLIFNSEKHEYRDSETNKIIPSVTQILKHTGFIDDRFYSTKSAQRGTDIHRHIEQVISTSMGPVAFSFSELSKIWEGIPYVGPVLNWLNKTGATILEKEKEIDFVFQGLHYAGRYDLLILINGKKVLIDIKTGVSATWHAAQLAGYALAVNPDARAILFVKEDVCDFKPLSADKFYAGVKMFQNACEMYQNGTKNEQ